VGPADKISVVVLYRLLALQEVRPEANTGELTEAVFRGFSGGFGDFAKSHFPGALAEKMNAKHLLQKYG
jgi:hypothetical protein